MLPPQQPSAARLLICCAPPFRHGAAQARRRRRKHRLVRAQPDLFRHVPTHAAAAKGVHTSTRPASPASGALTASGAQTRGSARAWSPAPARRAPRAGAGSMTCSHPAHRTGHVSVVLVQSEAKAYVGTEAMATGAKEGGHLAAVREPRSASVMAEIDVKNAGSTGLGPRARRAASAGCPVMRVFCQGG